MISIEKIKSGSIAVFAAFFSLFGLLAIPILLLVICQLTDWVTGIAAAKIRKEKITGDASFAGIMKKVCMYILILVGWVLDMLVAYLISRMNIDFYFPYLVSCIVAVWLVLSELISITENINELGIYVPFLAPIMNLIKSKVEDTTNIK